MGHRDVVVPAEEGDGIVVCYVHVTRSNGMAKDSTTHVNMCKMPEQTNEE